MRALALAFVAVFSLPFFVAPAFADKFRLPEGCEVPWKSIAVDRDISQNCGVAGDARGGPGHAQNKMKNNLCATNQPVFLTYHDFRQMQKRADQRRDGGETNFNFGNRQNPIRDRSKLRNFFETEGGETVGEGMVVRHVGFLAEARKARIGTSGESVNCKLTERDENDIHIDIVQTPGANPCRSVTAEMIPHFRPETWTTTNLNRIRDERIPVRVTGHLFFDSSHKPCDGLESPGPGHPLRVSIWEIHPVYRFEVCRRTSLAQCRHDDNSVWQGLHRWAEEN